MSVTVDSSAVARGSDIPGLALALDPEAARRALKRRLPRLSGEGKLRLKAIRFVRHKPGRRSLVEYEVEVDRPGFPKHRVTLLGKARAHRSGNEGFRLQQALWQAGFQADSADGISVPEPIGVISDFHMWFQRKVSGLTAEELLPTAAETKLAGQIAKALHKLHRAAIPTDKGHHMEQELSILHDCLAQVGRLYPQWANRLERLSAACDRLGQSTPRPRVCGIHRDFYGAQVLVDNTRVWLIDFDLYCQGDPALDAGNFIGHIKEQALREKGNPDGLLDVEQAFEEQFIHLTGEQVRGAVRAYTDLTLARHIYLSTKLVERTHLTEQVLCLCEERILSRI
ncbi:MAG TPA: phosphotransferase [Candidatus Limnocylindrales bacterium]|jgi:hypothetical protein|nr:phosphotransferase [Candidatus Limnocylindrales bacterium]